MTRVRRVFDSEIELLERYLDTLLTFSGLHLTPPLITILAYAVKHKNLTPEVKQEIAKKYNTSLQVVANNITKLRRMKFLKGSEVDERLVPKNRELSLSFTYADKD